MRGVTVTLYELVQVGTDSLNAPIYQERPVTVDDVLIGEPSTDDIVTSTDLYGKSIVCMLGIPKGDNHDWQDKRVEWTDASGRTYRLKTFGYPIMGIEANVPTRWHKKVRCAQHE